MMRGFLFFCAFLIAGSGIYQLISQDVGYLLIVWGKTSIETSLWFALLLLILCVLALMIVFRLLRGGFRGVLAAKHKVLGLSDEKAQAKTVDGLVDFIEGNWRSAKKKLTRSAGKVKAPIINYLAAARCAYEMGEEQQALELLHKAENSTDKGKLAVAITQARMQFANHKYEQALATLERVSTIQPEHPVVLNLRQQVYVALKDWPALKQLLPKLTKHNINTTVEQYQLELMLYREMLKGLIVSSPADISALQKMWLDIPRDLQQEQDLLSTYASQLMVLGEYDSAEKHLSEALNHQWHGQWLDLYGLLMCSDPKKLLQTAEKWLSKKPQSSHLLLALGRLCIQNQQWGRAVDFLEKSLSLQKRSETYAELARVFDYLGETEKSLCCYKEGLVTSATVLLHAKPFKV